MSRYMINKITTDLNQGLSSELQVQRILELHNWNVDLGYEYLEAGSNKPRTISLRAVKTKTNLLYDRPYAFIHFIILVHVEKSNGCRPWVVIDKGKKQAGMFCAWDNLIFARNLPDKPSSFIKPLDYGSLFTHNDWVAGGVFEALRKNDRPAQRTQPFRNASRAAYSYLQALQGDQRRSTITNDIMKNPCEFYFIQPVVVYHGELYRTALKEDNNLEVTRIFNAALTCFDDKDPFDNYKYRVDLTSLQRLNHYISLTEMRQNAVAGAMEFLAHEYCFMRAGNNEVQDKKPKSYKDRLMEYLFAVGEDPETGLTVKKIQDRAYDFEEANSGISFKMVRYHPALLATKHEDGRIAAYTERVEEYTYLPYRIIITARKKGERILVIKDYEQLAEDYMQAGYYSFSEIQEDDNYILDTNSGRYTVSNYEEALEIVKNELDEIDFKSNILEELREYKAPDLQKTAEKLIKHCYDEAFSKLEQAWNELINEIEEMNSEH